MEECRDVTAGEAAKLLAESDHILILTHMKPDGDTLGSGFAMFYALQMLGKTVRIENSDGFPARYSFLFEGFDPESQPQFPPEFILAVDIADTQLLGEKTESYKDRIDLCIDHHPSNSRYARRLLLDPRACATVQRVYDVIGALGVAPDKRIATCIYTGLSTDTGCFRYSNTTAGAHLLAAKMIEAGADHYRIDKLMFETKSVARMELERMVMDTLEYYYGNKFAVIVISQDAVERTGVPEEDLEGISSVPRQIEGVEASVTLRQKGPEKYRVSMRSGEKINSSKVCGRLGGGGHARAAGCMLEGDLESVKKQLVEAIREDIEPLCKGRGSACRS